MSTNLSLSKTLNRKGKERKKKTGVNQMMAFLFRERTNTPPPTLRQIYSKICVSLTFQTVRTLSHRCQGSVMESWQLQQLQRDGWPSAGQKVGAESPTHTRSWQMSYTSSTGTFCFLFTFLHPAARGLLSPLIKHTHIHKQTGRQTDTHVCRMDQDLYPDKTYIKDLSFFSFYRHGDKKNPLFFIENF